MNEPVVHALKILKLGLSAIVFLAGLAGFLIVMKQGVLVSGSVPGHDSSYVSGWSLFFLLMLGIPCLLAVVFGAVPWISWLKERRKERSQSG